jgi:hypothetical protein
MKDAMQAMQERRFNDAETSAKLAVDIAEKIQSQDGRFPEALGQLGNVFAWRMDFKNAAPIYKRQLTLYQKLYGAQSPMIAPALNNLARLALSQKDFAGAEGFFSNALESNQKTYGENSTAVAENLRGIAHVYLFQEERLAARRGNLRNAIRS